MRERHAVVAPIAAVAGVLGLCCGLPVLLSIGVLGAIAGWSVQSWALIGLGLVVAAVGGARSARRRRGGDTCRPDAVADEAAGRRSSTVDVGTGSSDL